MKLTTEEVNLFFELTLSLHLFVNTKLNIIPDIQSLDDYTDLPQESKYKVRERIYDQPDLIDDYISKNPDQLNDEKLGIVRQWKHFVRGQFYIERFLKDYAIFIDEDKVYGVLGLYQGFDEFFHKSHLPTCIQTVLLPFRGKIVYDGLMQSYNVFFGSGIKRSLKEDYMKAKQNGRIITALEDGQAKQSATAKKSPQKSKDWSTEIEQLVAISKKLKGGNGQPMINSPAFSLVKASIALANNALQDPSNFNALLKDLQKVERAAKKVEDTLYRMD
jgi:hypothetical protein